jgi:FtsP/CotA-like multicopper oxidase with cupredoxin domain
MTSLFPDHPRLARCAPLVVALLLGAAPLRGQADPCIDTARHLPSPDLYCMHLVPAPRAPASATGHLALDIAPGPFSIAVTRDGVHRYRPRLMLSGLPAASAIAPDARGYVAWVTTPRYAEWTSLGAVANGVTILPEVALNQFVVVITAERDVAVREPTGPRVLRGGSPSTRMQPPDFQELSVGVVGLTAAEAAGHDDHAAHAAPSRPGDPVRWTTVPMPDGFAMLPAEMLLRPSVGAQLPMAGAATPMVRRREVVRLSDGDTLTLVAGTVRKRIHGREYVMFGFNGQIPGPLLQVARGTSVTVKFINQLDQPSSVHWHGLRQDWRMDGAPPLSQDPVPAGGRFTYTLRFPDAGLYWYHPHVREEMQQDLGLSGNIMVQGLTGLPSVSREEVLLLDDLLIGDDGLVPFGLEAPTHALMGRFGNQLLVNGEPRWSDTMRAGETIRLWFTNAANTRTFNLAASNATMRLVAADMGTFPAPLDIESVVLAPAERYAVDLTPTGAGPVVLTNRVQAIDHLFGRFVPQVDTLGEIAVDRSPRTEDRGRLTPPPSPLTNSRGRATAQVVTPFTGVRGEGDARPDLIFEFGLRPRDLPFVTERMMLLDSAYFHPVEWSGTMPMMNWATTARQAQWFVRDALSGRENEAASFTVRRGAVRTIRLVNPRNSLHAMQHPVHMHGQRFQVVAVNGVATDPAHRAWKDTVLLPAGGTVDLVVEFTNPGHWMLHCHIAEHVESGMMTHFTVEE